MVRQTRLFHYVGDSFHYEFWFKMLLEVFRKLLERVRPSCLNQLTSKSTLVTIPTVDFLRVNKITRQVSSKHRQIARPPSLTRFSGGHCALR